MATLNLLYAKEYAINEHIKIQIPTVGDILNGEDDYYSVVTMLTAMPIDLIVMLDDIGVDFSKINEYDLFLILFNILRDKDASLVFGDLDLKQFEPSVNPQNNTVVLRDGKTGAIIDRNIHSQIASVLRKIHGLKRDNRRPANKEARDYMVQRARLKASRKKRLKDSQLEELIVAMVNTEQYHYGFEGTRELSIYQFNESVRQVIRKIDYDNKMYGIYAGTVKAEKLSQDDLNWLTHKNKEG